MIVCAELIIHEPLHSFAPHSSQSSEEGRMFISAACHEISTATKANSVPIGSCFKFYIELDQCRYWFKLTGLFQLMQFSAKS